MLADDNIHPPVKTLRRDFVEELEVEADAYLGNAEGGEQAVVESASATEAVQLPVEGDTGYNDEIHLILDGASAGDKGWLHNPERAGDERRRSVVR